MPTAARAPKRRAPRKPAPASIRGIVGDDTERETLIENPATEPQPVSESSPPKRAAAKPRAGSLESRLSEAFASIAIVPSFAGDSYTSFIIASRSGKFAHDLAELAKVNPRVKKILENALDGGAMGGVMFSGMAMLLPILWGYGILPAPPFDPFSAFYPEVPATVVPRSTAKAMEQSRRAASGQPGNPGVVSAQRNPPGSSGIQKVPSAGPPEGVVTVKPGAHPPISPAAAAQ